MTSDDDNEKQEIGGEYRPTLLYGTHLFGVPGEVELDEIESFPPKGAEAIDAVASSSRDEAEREDEYQRSAEQFKWKLEHREGAEQGRPGEQLVVAIGKGKTFAIAPWSVFWETYGGEA